MNIQIQYKQQNPFIKKSEPGQPSRYSDYVDYGLEVLRFESRQGQEMFLLSKMPRPALGPTKPPIQLAPETLPSDGKVAGALG
jgi:hypothetical protein